MATLRDVERLALAMPETVRGEDDDGRPSYSVGGKVICWHRSPRPDALDPKTGDRLIDVFVFRTTDLDVKEMTLQDDRGIFFTTPHWNGYPAVLIRIRDLKHVRPAELRDLVEEAWLSRAPKRVAKAWLAEHETESEPGTSTPGRRVPGTDARG
jgi:hypothetical protein